MKKSFEAVKKFVGLGIFLISLLLISSYVYAVYPANNLALNNNLMKDISPHINKAYALVPIGDTGGFGGGGIPIHYTVSTAEVNGAYGTISPGYISSIAPSNVVTFSVVPNSGYGASATGCGGSLSGTAYTTGAITSNCTVTATYKPLPPTVNQFYATFNNVKVNKVNMGDSPRLNWDISNFSSCTLTGGGLNYPFPKSKAISYKISKQIYAPTTYTLKCDTATGSPSGTSSSCIGTVGGGNGTYPEGYDCTLFKTQSSCLQGWATHGCSWVTS